MPDRSSTSFLTAQDYFEIQALVHRYPRLLDSGDLVGLGNLFAKADVHIQGVDQPIRSDPAEVTRMFVDFLQLYEGRPRTRHVMANLVIEPDGENAARASCMVVVFQQTAAFPLQPIITGDYSDRFRKVGGQWEFAERWISNDLFGNLSAHGRYTYQAPS